MYQAFSKFVNELLKSIKVNESSDTCECDSGEVCVVESKCAKWVMELERSQRRGCEDGQLRLQNLYCNCLASNVILISSVL